jgi:hypothetical protein
VRELTFEKKKNTLCEMIRMWKRTTSRKTTSEPDAAAMMGVSGFGFHATDATGACPGVRV